VAVAEVPTDDAPAEDGDKEEETEKPIPSLSPLTNKPETVVLRIDNVAWVSFQAPVAYPGLADPISGYNTRHRQVILAPRHLTHRSSSTYTHTT
jgi:hypothetical protein